ncbi:response regulator [Spirosoma flavum]|uniref:Response regulator n=1 Tax=Spirosoma flavum TaxID=2048557 RepID=A0ABW6AE07_9BACT
MATTIMLVDDSPICNLIMKKVLGRIPIDINTHDFTDPVLAFSQLLLLNPALVFLDLNMPQLDGWGFLEQMKATGQTNRVIILTSSTSALDRERCAEFPNVLAYYTKPLTQILVRELGHIFQRELAE